MADARDIKAPPFVDEGYETNIVALLYQQFGRVMIPLEDVRSAYFRNRSSERFRRALREGAIPLPVVRLDDSQKGQGYVCIYHLAALIEARALDAARDTPRFGQRMVEAVPTTHYPDETSG